MVFNSFHLSRATAERGAPARVRVRVGPLRLLRFALLEMRSAKGQLGRKGA